MPKEKMIWKIFKVFGAWQDEKEERWLCRMAKEGWRLKATGFSTYTFERTEPADLVYRTDYRVLSKKDRAEYEELFRAAGWEYVCARGHWRYFRTPAKAGSNPEIFSDTESRLQKYRRLALSEIALFLFLWLMILSGRPPLVVLIFFAVSTAFGMSEIVRLLLRIRKLKRDAKK